MVETKLQKLRWQRTITPLFIGAAVTVLVVAFDAAGGFDFLERPLFDLLARHFQGHLHSDPGDLVEIVIDDPSIELAGRFPWVRALLALTIDEIHGAGARVIAMDVSLPDAQMPSGMGGGAWALSTTQPGSARPPSQEDSSLAEAFRRAGGVVLPITCGFAESASLDEVQAKVKALLREHPGSDFDAVADQVSGDLMGRTPADGDFRRRVERVWDPMQRQALYERISDEIQNPSQQNQERGTDADLFRSLFADAASGAERSRLIEARFSAQLQRARSIAMIRIAMPQLPMGSTLTFPGALDPSPPIPLFTAQTCGIGFVDYLPDPDGAVRTVPLLSSLGGVVVPQLGLAMACASLGVPLDQRSFRVEADGVRLMLPNGQQRFIPTFSARYRLFSQEHATDGWINLPLRGGSNWLSMYASGQSMDPTPGVMSMKEILAQIWDKGSLSRASAAADDALESLPLPRNLALGAKEANGSIAWPSRRDRLTAAIANLSENPLFASGPRIDRLKEILNNGNRLDSGIQQRQASLNNRLGNKVALIGYNATGAVADVVPTALHPSCPGFAIHGAIYNAIMHGTPYRYGSPTTVLLVGLMLGWIVAGGTAFLPILYSTIAAISIAFGFAAIDAEILFNSRGTVFELSGPLCSIGITWMAATISKHFAARRVRAQVNDLVRISVDDRLLREVELRGSDVLKGDYKEMTVAFTDLVDFTTTTGKLQLGAVPLVVDYMNCMVPIIVDHNGYVNKFMGDGIMFFFNAPAAQSRFAIDAVATLLKMQEQMGPLNEEFVAKDRPRIAMRAGMATGYMLVGNAGSNHRCDYTVLGDIVNLASRLEGANKVLKTNMLVNERTAILASREFLLRIRGRISVVGRQNQPEKVYEPVCRISEATEASRRACQMSEEILDQFALANFTKCLSFLDALAEIEDPSTWHAAIRLQCEKFMKPEGSNFKGFIDLDSK